MPAELAAKGVTPETADHNDQISDYGFEIGGPLVRDTAWFYGSYSIAGHPAGAPHRQRWSIARSCKNPNLKLNWQATRRTWSASSTSTASRSRTTAAPARRASPSTRRPRRSTRTTPTPATRCMACSRSPTIASSRPNLFLSAKYAYYNTGFVLTPEGGMGLSSGRDLIAARSYGSTVQSLNVRPQMTANADLNSFLERPRRVARREVRRRLAPRQRDDRHAVAGQRHPRGRPERDDRRSRRSSAKAAAPTARNTSTPTSATRSRRGARRSTSASATTVRAAARCRARPRRTRRSRRSCPG